MKNALITVFFIISILMCIVGIILMVIKKSDKEKDKLGKKRIIGIILCIISIILFIILCVIRIKSITFGESDYKKFDKGIVKTYNEINYLKNK